VKIPRGSGPRGGPSGRPNVRAPKQRPINYYDILAISPDSSIEEIRAGYHERIAQYHPDCHSSSHAHAIAALINEAWEVLRDEGRRRLYDIELGTAPRRPGVRAKAPASEPPVKSERLSAKTAPLETTLRGPSTVALEANRRASSRVKTLVTTWVTTPARVRTGSSATSTCVDLSVNGMAFTLGRALEVGSVVTATLQLPDGSLNVAATIVRAEALKRSRWKIAARFGELSGPDRQRVAEYLADERRSRLE
jgi:DnaJ-like protein/PilZ domain-containing protein